MHDSYILYEEIAKNEGYASAFDNIKGAYQKYKDAKVSGNGQELAKAAEDYATRRRRRVCTAIIKQWVWKTGMGALQIILNPCTRN